MNHTVPRSTLRATRSNPRFARKVRHSDPSTGKRSPSKGEGFLLRRLGLRAVHLVAADVVDLERLRERGGRVRGAGPLAAYRHVDEQEERVLELPSVGRGYGRPVLRLVEG